MEKVRKSIGFTDMKVISSNGSAGGLCMMWSDSVKVNVIEFDDHIIAIEIIDGVCDWVLVGFYGPPYAVKRKGVWENLSAFLESVKGPWVCFGDFNVVINDEEKQGGVKGNTSTPNYLQEIMFELGAVDLGFSGNKFTWTNKRWGKNAIKERLDRGIANMSWRLKFPKATIYHLGAIKSDHCPILLDTNPSEEFFPRPFRFEAAWTRDPGSYDVIRQAWKEEIREMRLCGGKSQEKPGFERAIRTQNSFHLSTVIRRRRNAINIIKSDGGEWITEKKKIREHFQAKFIEHFSEEEVEFPPDLEGLVPHSITTEENEELCRIPTPQEIKKALFDMPTLKAPGPDGFPVLFYKKYWDIVGNNVIKAVLNFFQDGRLLPEVNNSSIVLIPKIPNPTSVNHFRPISLCNVVYKTIAKILVARIRPLLHKLISPCQSAFIPGRWIAENGVIVHEMLHSFKKRKTKSFIPSRGLRQGDPLSPYLFILSQDILSRIIENQFNGGGLSGVKASIGSPAITHVMYADDIVMFSKATRNEASNLNHCIEKYCKWSGQLVNRNKSGLFFSKHTQKPVIRSIKQLLQMKSLKNDAMYLGSPMFTSSSSIKDFKYLQDKLESRLMGWRSKCLSWAGRCTMIKSVAQALPTYTMSTFEVPKKICENLDAVTRRFWWNPKTPSGRFLAWKSWDALCLPKKDGGLGFRKNKNFNKALLAKLAWMVVSNRNSICMKLVRSKYKVRGDWLFKDPVKNSSPLWRAIEKTKKLITKGACFLVGDGTSINVWKDPWIPWLQDFKARPKNDNDQQFPIMVSSLIDSNSHCWKQELLEQLFDSATKEAINKITIPLRPRNDKIVWLLEKNGLFSVKSAYNLCQNLPNTNQNAVEWSKIWKLKAHERSKMFLWRIAANVLPTKDLLAERVGNMDTLCNLCNEEVETCSHLFFKCNVARAIWYGCKWSLRSDEINVNRNEEIVKIVIDPPWKLPKESREQVSLQMIITLEAIWNLRNQITHNGGEINLISTIKGIEARVQEFLLSQELPPQHIHMDVTKWSTPPPNVVKLNVDAAILRNHSTLAVIARNDKGEVLKAWAKQSKCCDPLQAETSAVLWALQLAASESFMHIIIEGDAK
uniref:Reverse transcriptase domain-containing protein n=1 Tax=Fagus sylvatica TaxID=28930 RepID=A0A2N9H629_FAGSY